MIIKAPIEMDTLLSRPFVDLIALSMTFNSFFKALNENNTESEIFKHFLNSKNKQYRKKNKPQVIVRDFIAGMTDRYFTFLLKKLILPDIVRFND